ncbi:hypothetical protein WJX79_001658 [Trebouxia sp. C0005]
MFCRPRTRRVRLHRTWPAQLWGPLGLDSVEAVTVLNTQGRPQPHSQRKLQTNDEALVENKTVASLAGQTDMTPDLWSEMLSPGPGNLCLESSKAIKHDLWQNQLWLKRKAEAARQADSDEDDTEQFGIQEGNAEGTTIVAEFAGAPADDDEDEGDAYPLYGQDDSDFGDTGSDAEGTPQQSRGAEEDLSKSDAEPEQVSLEEAYRSILEGTGLSAEALQTWLEPWMQHVTVDIIEEAKRGIACLIPGSKAAELIVESRLGRAVVMIAENLHTMHKQWEQTQLSQLERKSYKLWRQSQNPNQIQTWQGDAEHWRGQVAKLVHAVALIHVGNARLPVRAIKKSSRSIQQMYVNLQEVVFKLKVSELLQEPTRPSRKRPAPARSGEEESYGASAASHDSRSHDDDNLSGSWLVDDEADANEAGAAEVVSKQRHVHSADNSKSSPAGSQSVGQLGIWVEVCSRPAVGQWSWRLASFQGAALPASGLVSVTYKASSSELSFSVKSELVNVEDVRHMAPSDTYVGAVSELQRGAAVEVDMGDGKAICAVLVAKIQRLTLLGKLLKSIQGFDMASAFALQDTNNLHPGPEKTVCIVYSPELRSFLSVPEAFLGTRLRHAMSWSRDMESFVPLNKYAKAELLEGCSLDGSDSSAKHVAARRDAAALHVYGVERSNGVPDAKLQWRFTRRYLARQPTLPFKKTKKLLNVKPTLARKKRIAELTAGPMKGIVAGARSPSGNKRKCNNNPPGRWQPDEHAEAGASQKEQREEQGRQQREADALKQQQKLRKRKEKKKERRQSLAANTATPRLSHVTQADAGALPLFPEQKTDTQVMVAGCMATQLKPHQWAGVTFLWTNIVLDFEDPDDEDAGGCILAHSMGLGKSLQTIAFLHTFFAYYPDQRSLLLVPSNVVHNWVEEFHHWLPQGRPETDDELTPSKVIIYDKPVDVHTWMSKKATVLIISYDKFSRLRKQSLDADLMKAASEPTGKAVAARQAFQTLVNEAGVVVADEGHQIKNPSTKRFAAVTSVKTKRRIALTGYPLQNNLDEYYTMIMWCMDDLLGDAAYFHDTFSKPIQDGQKAEASMLQVQHMYQQLSVLANLTEGFVHRIGPEQLFRDLPAKHEHVVLLCLDTAQQAMYKAYLEAVEKYGRDTLMDTTFLHLLSHRPKEALKRLRSMQAGNAMQIEDAVKEAVVEGHVAQPHAADQSTAAGLAHAPSTDSQGREAARTDTPEAASDRDTEAEAAGTKAQPRGRSKGHKLPPEAVQQLLAVADDLAEKGTALGQVTTAKAWAVQHILHRCKKHNEKLVIFSQYLMDLDELEHVLQHKFQWSKNKQYLRLDGKVSSQIRQQHTRLFNDPTSSVQVYLISTKAGSVGINLTAAFRMIIYDELWNPVHNAQAIARIYRYGQKRATFVYRLLYKGTAEHRVYRRNVDKEGLFMKVVDKQTVKGTNKLEDVDIYAFDPPAPADKGTLHNVAVNSTDAVLQSLLRTDVEQDRWIAGWENHKENLPEDPSQKLTAEQRREAAKRYTLEQDTTRGCVAGAEKRKRLVRKRFADDEDFQLTTAETALLAKQAVELQDYDQLPTPATQQAPPLAPVKGSADAARGSKSASFRSVLDSLGRKSPGKKAMAVDEGALKEKTNGHAGKSLQAIAARQMAEALSKKKQNRSAGIQTSSGKQRKSIQADRSPDGEQGSCEDQADKSNAKEAAAFKLAAAGGDQPRGKPSDSSLAAAKTPSVHGTSRLSSGADKSSDNADKLPADKASDKAATQGKSSGDAGDKPSEQSGARRKVRLPDAPLFLAGSPAGADRTVQWVQRYKLEHPECSDAEALTAWRAARSQALRRTPDKHVAERHNTSALDSVRSSLPQLTGSAKASHTLSHTQATNPHVSQAPQAALDKPRAAAVPSTGSKGDTGHGLDGSKGEAVTKQGTSGLGGVKAGQSRGAVVMSASGQPAAAPAHAEHATCGPTSESARGKPQEVCKQIPGGLAPKGKRDESALRGARIQAGKGRKGHSAGGQPQGTSESQVEKRHKGQMPVADKEGSSKPHTGKRSNGKLPDTEAAPHDSSMPAWKDSAAGITSAKAPEASRAQKCRRSTSSSPDLSQTAQLGSPVVMPSPGAFPELSQASRFAALSPRTNQLSSPPPQKHTPKGRQIGSPTLQEMYSRHEASRQSPKAPQPTPSSDNPVSSVAVFLRAAREQLSNAKLVVNPADASSVDPSLVKHGAELLSEALQSSSPDSVADSEGSAEKAGGSSKAPRPVIAASSKQKPGSQSLPGSSHQAPVVAELSLAGGSAQRPGLQSQRDDKQAVLSQGLKHSKSERKHRRDSRPVRDGGLIDLTQSDV